MNLLAGMVLPGVDRMTGAELEQFRPSLLLLGVFIHAVMSVVLGLIYGVLLPTLPPIPRPLAWGGLLMPLLWTGVSFVLMGSVNPVLSQRGGLALVHRLSVSFRGRCGGRGHRLRQTRHPILTGLVGGIVGGLADARAGVALEPDQRPWHLVSRRTCWPVWSCPAWDHNRRRS